MGRTTWFVGFDEEVPIDERKILETAQVRRCPSCQTFLIIRRVLLAPPPTPPPTPPLAS